MLIIYLSCKFCQIALFLSDKKFNFANKKNYAKGCLEATPANLKWKFHTFPLTGAAFALPWVLALSVSGKIEKINMI